MKHNHTIDPHAEKMGKGKVGIVGESHIWDGPLSQVGRLQILATPELESGDDVHFHVIGFASHILKKCVVPQYKQKLLLCRLVLRMEIGSELP